MPTVIIAIQGAATIVSAISTASLAIYTIIKTYRKIREAL